jgi:hypothetical protein
MPACAVCLRQMRDDPSQGRASQAALEVDPSRRRFLHRRQYSKQRQPTTINFTVGCSLRYLPAKLNPKHAQRLADVLHDDSLSLPAVVKSDLLRR